MLRVGSGVRQIREQLHEHGKLVVAVELDKI